MVRTIKCLMKIVFVQYHPNTLKTERDYHLDALIHHGFAVEYWDLTDLFSHNIELPDAARRSYEYHFSSYRELERALDNQNIGQTIFIVQITYGIDTLKLYILLSKKKCILYHHFIGGMPPGSPRVLDKLRNNISPRVIPKIYKRAIPSLCLKVGLVRPYEVVFAAGQSAIERFQRDSTVVPINLFDYDSVLLDNHESLKSPRGAYCVYLDDYWPFHPDVEILDMPRLDPGNHYALLNRFFDQVEQAHGVQVAIAAHPKSTYDSNPFGGREIYKYETRELTKGCSFAISSISTSISYVVAYSKPALIVYTDEIRRKYKYGLYNEILSLARELNCGIYNMDHLDDQTVSIKEVDRERYDRYKFSYLTSIESQNRLSVDIVLAHFGAMKARLAEH